MNTEWHRHRTFNSLSSQCELCPDGWCLYCGPCPLDSYKTGLITPVLTNRRPSQLHLCDSPSLSSPALTEATTTGAQNPSACIVVKLIVAININQWSHWHRCCFCRGGGGGGIWSVLPCPWSVYLKAGARHGINMLQAAHISLVAPAGMRRTEG